MNNGSKKQKYVNQISKPNQKRYRKISATKVVAAIFVLAVLYAMLPKQDHKSKSFKLRIGVTEGIPYIITKETEKRYGSEYLEYESTEMYSFQDC